MRTCLQIQLISVSAIEKGIDADVLPLKIVWSWVLMLASPTERTYIPRTQMHQIVSDQLNFLLKPFPASPLGHPSTGQ